MTLLRVVEMCWRFVPPTVVVRGSPRYHSLGTLVTTTSPWQGRQDTYVVNAGQRYLKFGEARVEMHH
jgi:hypothetical protein